MYCDGHMLKPNTWRSTVQNGSGGSRVVKATPVGAIKGKGGPERLRSRLKARSFSKALVSGLGFLFAGVCRYERLYWVSSLTAFVATNVRTGFPLCWHLSLRTSRLGFLFAGICR